jgi:hypothetical protein
MDSETSSIGSKSRASTFSVVQSTTSRTWNEHETRQAIQSVEAITDAMLYRGFLNGRIVHIERMNAYIKSQFDIAGSREEHKTASYDVHDCHDPWVPLGEVMTGVRSFFDDRVVQLGLQTLDYIPVIEVSGEAAERYTPSQLSSRHDARFERELIDAMAPDWGDATWYTTPARAYAKEHGDRSCIGVVVRTPYARS